MEKNLKKNIYSTPETNTILEINYTSILKIGGKNSLGFVIRSEVLGRDRRDEGLKQAPPSG